jgi:hypothetical protein
LRRIPILVAAALCHAGAAFPQSGATPSAPVPIDYETARFDRVFRATRTTAPIVIDGLLDEPAWTTAQPATDFVQVQPRTGERAVDQTEVRVLYDDVNLYVAARCFDSSPKDIRINTLAEDFESNNTDMFGFVIDSLNDRVSGFEFFINPAGARHDAQIFRDGELTNIDWDGVWEVATTIDELGWTAEVVIPFKTLRFSSADEQQWGFNAVRRVRRSNEDSTWSPLPLRIRSITRTSWAGMVRGLEGVRQGRNVKVKPFAIGSAAAFGGPVARTDRDADFGVDFKYGLTPAMTVDLTYRTDFSQVEVDEQQVNLTRFNVQFPEKREFFLENQGVFTIAATPGDPPNLLPFFSRRIGLSEDGAPIPIVGGARMSGRTGTYDVGVLTMRTDEFGARPGETFAVGRLRKNLPNASSAGAIFTSRDSARAGANRVFGADSLLRFFGQRLDVASYFMASDTPGLSGRNQARLLGAAWRDDALTWAAQYEHVGSNFNPEIGFIRRRAMTHYDTEVTWQPRPRDASTIRHYIVEGGADYYADGNGDLETRLQSGGAGLTLQNGAQVVFRVQNTFDRLVDPFEIRPSVTVQPGDYEYARYSVTANSDPSRRLSGSVSTSIGEFWDGTSEAFRGSFAVRPSHHLTITGTLDYNTADLPAGSFDATLVGVRVFYGFSSNAFLNTFVQYNASVNQFSSNTRFNLIHRPLSDLFVVYNERRDTSSRSLIDRAIILKFTNLFDF